MNYKNEAEMNEILNGNTQNNHHSAKLPSGNNCSTSSTDSGVIFIDNVATFNKSQNEKATAKETDYNNSAEIRKGTDNSTIPIAEVQRISIEQTVNIKNAPPVSKAKKCSPTLSIRSTTISIVSIDENAVDSSCIDSDSEAGEDADAEGDHNGYTVQKLGQQMTYPPNSADLPQLNKGLTVIGQQIRPNNFLPSNGLSLPGPGLVAEQLINGNLAATTPTTPQVAVTNSTDVTIGDKHFYEGPVTIQQFLIDNREKWKAVDGDGHDNPGFNGTAAPNGPVSSAKSGEPATNASTLCPGLPHTIGRKALVITGTFVLLTIILGVVLAQTTTFFEETVHKNDDVVANGTLELVDVGRWGGSPSKHPLDRLSLPVHRVIISHTASESCESEEVCKYRVRVIQEFHMNGWGWDDVGYNFMVGGDGRIYVGRGWDCVGAHTKGYNMDSIGISFIGTFNKILPTEQQLQACQLLIAEGVRLKKLDPDYKLYGHRQLSATESPGALLYKIIKTWPHWSSVV
ncbi:peptidoglycan-recognition protein LC isoform X3 [Scaptodrosophila lebanonensis]|uniref:Peptidoglycan-recognition protein LC isoform X3 n=1 Tax=Drosophila lebanonensis TaxID=7225 RepID=A0A6J2TBF5_DROLE|nr:peptidoglycan-recognition protein LC isoform X3 [Scaptodrosophila lebanonensis]